MDKGLVEYIDRHFENVVRFKGFEHIESISGSFKDRMYVIHFKSDKIGRYYILTENLKVIDMYAEPMELLDELKERIQ